MWWYSTSKITEVRHSHVEQILIQCGRQLMQQLTAVRTLHVLHSLSELNQKLARPKVET